MIGRTCDLPDTGYSGSPCYAYFALDDLELDTAEQLDTIQISDNGWTEPDQYALSAEVNDSGWDWQWYLDGIALEGQKTPNCISVTPTTNLEPPGGVHPGWPLPSGQLPDRPMPPRH